MKTPRLYLLFCLLVLLPSAPLESRDFSVGIRGGWMATNDIRDISGQSESKRYVAGPVAEFQIHSRLSLEFSGLYRRVGYSSYFLGFPSTSYNWVRGNSWEFPLNAKYYFTDAKRFGSPYVSGGYVLRNLSNLKEASLYSVPRIENGVWVGYDQVRLEYDTNATHNNTHGISAAAGLRFGSGRIRLSPEVRYTHWFNVPFDESSSRGYRVFSSENRLDFTLLITFAPKGKP